MLRNLQRALIEDFTEYELAHAVRVAVLTAAGYPRSEIGRMLKMAPIEVEHAVARLRQVAHRLEEPDDRPRVMGEGF